METTSSTTLVLFGGTVKQPNRATLRSVVHSPKLETGPRASGTSVANRLRTRSASIKKHREHISQAGFVDREESKMTAKSASGHVLYWRTHDQGTVTVAFPGFPYMHGEYACLSRHGLRSPHQEEPT